MYQAQTIPQQSMQQPGTANPSAPLPPQVPPGWTAHWDQSQQKFYFHNSIIGIVAWDYSHQNSLPTSPPGNVHYPPQQQQMQGFDPSATSAPQYQQQYQHPANIPVDPTAVGQPQPQHQQQRYGGKEYGGEEYCGEGYGECAGGGGFGYGGGGMLGGGGYDPFMTGISNGSSYIYSPYMMGRLNAESLAHDAIMTGLKNSASYISGPATMGVSNGYSHIYNPYMTSRLDAQSVAQEAMMTGLKNSASYI